MSFDKMHLRKYFLLSKRKLQPYVRYVVLLGFLVFLLHPDRNGRGRYRYIPRDKAIDEMAPGVSHNLSLSSMVECDYRSVLFEETLADEPIELSSAPLAERETIRDGGEFVPQHCRPVFSTAVIVPYRDREEQLHSFLIYMHNFLRKQSLHYRIYVIEQINRKPFNRARLLNIGAAHAMRAGFPCLALHDVDLLPLHSANLYACTKSPRHMSCSVNKFRYTLPYLSLFGGAVSILATQYSAINGMSNDYFGWGAEDDDLSRRLVRHGLAFCRFEPEVSRYFMARHKPEPKSTDNQALLDEAYSRMDEDGLNSLQYSEVSTVLHPLFTHIMVDF